MKRLMSTLQARLNRCFKKYLGRYLIYSKFDLKCPVNGPFDIYIITDIGISDILKFTRKLFLLVCASSSVGSSSIGFLKTNPGFFLINSSLVENIPYDYWIQIMDVRLLSISQFCKFKYNIIEPSNILTLENE